MFLKLSIFVLFIPYGLTVQPCQTPDGQYGECKRLRDCQSYYEHTKSGKTSILEYIRRSHCGFSKTDVKVCCLTTPPNLLDKKNLERFVVSSHLLPKYEECGINLENKIVGGENTELDEFPWMVLLDYEDEFGTHSFQCGGALINKRYVLTAAHCIKPSLISVRLGEYDIFNVTDCIGSTCTPSPIDVPVEEKIVFKSYNPNDPTSYHDIALVRLNQPIEYTDYIKPICLPLSLKKIFDTNIEEEVTVSGWGMTELGIPSNTKRKVDIFIRKCKTSYNQGRIRPDYGQVCAGGQNGKDSCKGDSGGPLMLLELDENYDAHWYAIGVASFGPFPCGQGNPGIYTKVAKYIYWIVDNLRD